MYKQPGRHFQKLEIGLSSPKQIRSWAERSLPTGEVVGEVTSWETVNYKTLKPEPNGLFCQRIFGPITDYTCACGKKSNKVQFGFCPKCGVERTTARVRRYRLGYIQLKQPVVHSLYASYKPSPFSLCLKWPNKRIQAVMYATEFCHLSSDLVLLSSRFDLYRLLMEQEINNNNIKFEKILNLLLSLKLKILPHFQTILFDNKDLFQPRCSRVLRKVTKKKEVIPKLFKKQTTQKLKAQNRTLFYPNFQVNLATHVYGIAYDMTWRQVEDLQDFLVYILEQPFSYECAIPYYNFSEPVHRTFMKEKIYHHQFYPIQTGGFVFRELLSTLDLVGLQVQMKFLDRRYKKAIFFLYDLIESIAPGEPERKKCLIKLRQIKELERKNLRSLHYCRDFFITKTDPSWMVLSILPVLPPGLRPITSIRGELVVSDINSLYRKVLTRNKRVSGTTQFGIFDTALSGSWSSWCYNLRQVQEAVDNLLKKGSTESGKTTKSLLDALKGKKGRFRQHLLGKRVDYSGRSVIVVGPKLKIHECGLPKQMAIQLFQPFLIQTLRKKRIALTTTAAKSIISERKPFIWSILEEIMINHPILLNRAPTLHRLGIQAFLPKLVEGKAILLHPLVCPAFNADFDGDQMAVHIPLSPAARAEAFNLLWSRNHLLSPASGQPLLLPTQDMVLGCYYLTISKELILKTNTFSLAEDSQVQSKKFPEFYFSNVLQIQNLYDREKLETHTPVWVVWSGQMQNFVTEHQAKIKEIPLEVRVDFQGNSDLVFYDRVESQNFEFAKVKTFIRTTPGRVCFHDYLVTTVFAPQ